MPTLYKYRLRPAYGFKELLLQFNLSRTDIDFVKDLFLTIKEINPKVRALEDWWMNDEVVLKVSSDMGDFTVSRDIWNFAFMMARKNQSCIMLIDKILQNSALFEKEDVGLEDYKNFKT